MVEPVTTTTIRVGPPITTPVQSEAVTSQGSQPTASTKGRPDVPMYIFPQVGGYGYIDKRTYSVAADQLYETLSSVYSGLTIREIADYPPRQSYGSVVAAVFRPEVSEQQRKAGLQKIIVDLGLTETTAVNGFRIYTGRIQGYEKIVAIRNEVLLDFSSTTKAIDSNLSVVVNKMLALFGPA